MSNPFCPDKKGRIRMFSPIYLSVIPTKKINKIMRIMLQCPAWLSSGIAAQKQPLSRERLFYVAFVFVTYIP
jgi:hypothetical protein